MKICSKCILNDNIPSVHIDNSGICNYCSESRSKKKTDDDYNESLFFEKYKDKPYQVLLAYSGGKDSSYTLSLLVEKYRLSVLPVTFDNGYMSERCFKNIRNVTGALGTDSVIVRYPFALINKLFFFMSENQVLPKKAVERASSICVSCMSTIKALMYREAIQREIPVVTFGWTPGQFNLRSRLIKLEASMLLSNQDQIRNIIVESLGCGYDRLFLDREWLENNKERIPYLYYPFTDHDYNEDEIIRHISRLGWEKTTDTDANSTNCRLNSYANHVHMREYGFHPYCMEIANMVRNGLMSRDEGLLKIEAPGNEDQIRQVREMLSEGNRQGTIYE